MEWHDYLRAANAVLCAVGLWLLFQRYAKGAGEWNLKTKDYWFALCMWMTAGLVMSIEGILRDSTPGLRLVFILAGSLATVKAVLKKGSWGGS